MARHDMARLADALGLLHLVEDRDRAVVAGRRARKRLGEVPPADLRQAIARLLELPEDDADLLLLVAKARAGEACGGRFGAGHVYLAPHQDGTVEVLLSLAAQAPESDLAGAVAHEVANALSAVVGWARLSRTRPDEVDPAEALRHIEGGAAVAEEAARELMRSVRGEPARDGARADVTAVAHHVARLLRPIAVERGVTVVCRSDAPAIVAGARGSLFTALWNLGHNAVGILPEGGSVEIAVEATDDRVLVEVIDDGPGMSPETASRIFDPGYSERPGGNGYGLPAVRMTVESLGGTVVVRTERERGTTFHVELPRAQRSVVPAATGSRPPSRKHDSGVIPRANLDARILVVEDDRVLRALLETALSLRGARVTTVGSGAEAARVTGQFDLMVVDLTLGDDRGDRVMASLRQRLGVRRAVLMSGREPPATLAAGAEPDAWLRKPFEPDELMALVNEVLSKERDPGASHG